MKYWLSGLLLILVVVGIGWYFNLKNEQTLNQIQTEKNALKESNRILEQGLKDSERIRVVLGARFDSLCDINKTLVRSNSKLDSSLSRVKGSYNKRSVSELELEMITRFNATK